MSSKNQITDLARDLEREVSQARKLGDVRNLLEVAKTAIDRLEAAAGAAGRVLDEDQVMALNTARRIGYNAAADVWPGWEIGAPARSEEELEAAQALARRSSLLVERLGLGTVQRGTAIWLIGAFDLARERRREALTAFSSAADFYADAPLLKLLSEGYMAIAAEVSAISSTGKTPGLASVIAALEELASEEATEFRNQLLVARQIFNRL